MWNRPQTFSGNKWKQNTLSVFEYQRRPNQLVYQTSDKNLLCMLWTYTEAPKLSCLYSVVIQACPERMPLLALLTNSMEKRTLNTHFIWKQNPDGYINCVVLSCSDTWNTRSNFAQSVDMLRRHLQIRNTILKRYVSLCRLCQRGIGRLTGPVSILQIHE